MAALLAAIFSSSMVLQRNAPIPVWGFQPSGTAVDVSLNGTVQSATADATGRWAVSFQALPVGGPYFLTANASTGVRQELQDVLVGDVVLCSGQSNQDMPVSYAFNATAEAAAAALYPSLRYFTVYANYSSVPLREFIKVGSWVTGSNSGVASSFGAVCWFAVRDTYNLLRASGSGDVPMGMVHSALGGTPIQEWTSAAAAAVCPPAQPPMYRNYSGLYNAMIAPMVLNGMRISHTVWYQGEANCLQASYYSCFLAALSTDWQRSFQHSGSPGRFFVVQLHAWNASTDPSNVYYYAAIAGMRAAQAAGVALSPGAELATAVDGGDPQAPATSIHPRGKQLPGQRLARAIAARRYGLPGIAYSAPSYAGGVAAPAQGLALSVSVTLATAGSSSGGAPPQLQWLPPSPASNSSRCPTDLGVLPVMCRGFEVMLSDAPFPAGTWVPALAQVDAAGTGLVLSATATRAGLQATGSRFGWGAWPVVNAYTVDGELPVLPWQEAL